MKAFKEFAYRAFRVLFRPFHVFYENRNGCPSTEPRQEVPNDALLGLVCEKLDEGHTAVIWVKGYSMRPFIECDRDKVKLKPVDTLCVGDAVLAQIAPGHYVLHRIIRIVGADITLQGDGNISGEENCRMTDVCGIVTEYIRPNRTISASDPSLRCRIRVWRMLRPIRRYLLFFYRAII